jgi:hypothetical protein
MSGGRHLRTVGTHTAISLFDGFDLPKTASSRETVSPWATAQQGQGKKEQNMDVQISLCVGRDATRSAACLPRCALHGLS